MSFGVLRTPVGAVNTERAALVLASLGVTLFLEALGGDVVAIGFTTPPSAFRRPRGFPSSSRRLDLSKPSDHFLELGLCFRGPTGNRRPRPGSYKSGVWKAPPMDFVARSAFAANGVGLEVEHSRFNAIPSQRFSRPQGFNPLLALPPFADG
jgi:hypothetical protein